MIKYGINTDSRYFGRNVIIRLDELKTELIEVFQSDFEEVVRYFKLDGHLIATKRKKWEEKKHD